MRKIGQRLLAERPGNESTGSLRWLLTYADMITLLMAFFIMMYSMSVINLNRFKDVAVSVRSGFGGDNPGEVSVSGGDFSMSPSAFREDTAGVPMSVVNGIQRDINKSALQGNMSLYADRRGLVISMSSDEVVFTRGSASIRPEAMPVLMDLSEALREVPNEVRVEGHTCDLPISTWRYPSNWELSAARATEVVRFLIGRGKLDASRVSAAGYADTRPVSPNDSEGGRRANRRVEIVILRPFTP